MSNLFSNSSNQNQTNKTNIFGGGGTNQSQPAVGNNLFSGNQSNPIGQEGQKNLFNNPSSNQGASNQQSNFVII